MLCVTSIYPQFGIVINKKLYDNNPNVQQSLQDYINALRVVDHNDAWIEEFDFDNNNFVSTNPIVAALNPQNLRSILQLHYQTDPTKLQGVIFVGDLPFIRTSDASIASGGSFPTDVYWGDMDGTWSNWQGPGTNTYGVDSKSQSMEIWVSRIPSHTMVSTFNDPNAASLLKDASGKVLTESGIVSNYFEKVVNRMTKPSTAPYTLACFADEGSDLNGIYLNWQNWWLNPSGLGFAQDATTTYTWNNYDSGIDEYTLKGIKQSWINELQKGNTIILSLMHSDVTDHHTNKLQQEWGECSQ
jgi:hypothetical protein